MAKLNITKLNVRVSDEKFTGFRLSTYFKDETITEDIRIYSCGKFKVTVNKTVIANIETWTVNGNTIDKAVVESIKDLDKHLAIAEIVLTKKVADVLKY